MLIKVVQLWDMICEIHMHPEQTLFPKSASFMDKKTGKMSSAPLEKMAPFMNDDLQNLCIFNYVKRI